MHASMSFLRSWLHLAGSFFFAMQITWAGTLLLQNSSSDQLSTSETVLAVIVTSGIQSILASIYMIPFVIFRNYIITKFFPFLKIGYVTVVIFITLIFTVLWSGAGLSICEIVMDPLFWKYVAKYQFVAYLSIVIWGVSYNIFENSNILKRVE